MRTPRAYRRVTGLPLATLEAVESTAAGTRRLTSPAWHALRAEHETRVDRWLTPHLERRRRGAAHPVEDFLFSYYSHRPAALRRWHPGHGLALEDAAEYAGLKGYVVDDGVARVTDEHVRSQRPLLESLHQLLSATAARTPSFGCFGLHEWAMVYRLTPDQVRHAAWPLRLGAQGTDDVVRSHRIGCSHFDAFRFFTEPARSLNVLQPGRDDRAGFEQPGCLHGGMDLYKHAFRLSPSVSSDLVADCFALAREIRVLDMRASPYDLSELGFDPVPIETPEGKQAYVEAQRSFAERGAPLRSRLIEECTRLLDV